MPRAYIGAGLLPDVSEKRMFKDYTLQTTWGRALKALVAGAALGAASVVAFLTFDLYRDFGADIFLNIALFRFTFSFLVAFIVWALGLVFMGCPVWFLLHKYGYRTRLNALIIGFTFPFTAGFWLAPEIFDETANALLAAIGNSVLLGLSGTFVALTVWVIAYSKPANHA